MLVQDFERARLVSDPASGVHLANLGSVYVGAFPPPDAGQAAFGLRGTPLPPAGIRASVSVQRPTVGQGGQQVVYVVVGLAAIYQAIQWKSIQRRWALASA